MSHTPATQCLPIISCSHDHNMIMLHCSASSGLPHDALASSPEVAAAAVFLISAVRKAFAIMKSGEWSLMALFSLCGTLCYYIAWVHAILTCHMTGALLHINIPIMLFSGCLLSYYYSLHKHSFLFSMVCVPTQ